MSRYLKPVFNFDPYDPRPLPERLMDEIGCNMDNVDLPNGKRYYSAANFLKPIYGSKVARNYQGIEFVHEADLYWLVQTMPHKSEFIQAVKTYFADAGVIPHTSELDDIDVERFTKMNKPTSWVEARISGIVDRNRFTDALERAILDFFDQVFFHATEALYVGLWERTTARLRGDLGIDSKQSLRDHMGEYALIYIRLSEKASGDLLNDADEVPYEQAMQIVRKTAQFFRTQAEELSKELGIDLVTDKPLRKPKQQNRKRKPRS